jgi:hypothetical protein
MSGHVLFRSRLAQAPAFTAANDEKSGHPILNEFREIVLAGYNWVGRFLNVAEANPLSYQVPEQELAAAVAIVVATPQYFPSSAGMAMLGFKDLSAGFTTVTGANAGDTMKVEFQVSDDTTNPPAAGSWTPASAVAVDQATAALGPAAGWLTTSVGPALTTAWTVNWNKLNVRRFRFLVTAGVHDGTLTRLHIRQTAL